MRRAGPNHLCLSWEIAAYDAKHVVIIAVLCRRIVAFISDRTTEGQRETFDNVRVTRPDITVG